MNEDDKKFENQINAPESSNDSNEQVKLEVENEANFEKQESNIEEERNLNEVIHKKDGRLHIYVRQDKYKGELKSKNWVGRLYINGKQKISSSGTKNLCLSILGASVLSALSTIIHDLPGYFSRILVASPCLVALGNALKVSIYSGIFVIIQYNVVMLISQYDNSTILRHYYITIH